MSEDPFEAGQKPKFPQIWKLPDAPVHEARTAATLLKHDDVELGDLLMIVCSAAVKLDVTPQGPKITRVDNDPSYNGVCQTMSYCYPFVACKVLTGPMKDERIALDVRRHKIIKVSKTFARALLKPEPEPEQPADGGLIITGGNPQNAMERLGQALRGGGWRMHPPDPEPEHFPPDNLPPPDVDDDAGELDEEDGPEYRY
jgi:hypothetical protein